jgi:FkbM family methyltransferase
VALIKRELLNTVALWLSYFKLFPWLFRLNKDSIVLDCGANVGRITSYLSITGATIYAFEPDPIAFKILIRRCKNKKNVTCINIGVWHKDAVVQLYRHKEMREEETSFTIGSSIVNAKKNVDSGSFTEIEVIDLLTFIRHLNKKVDLVKVDIEGAEIEILKKIIAEDAHTLFKIMFVETHETKIPGQGDELIAIKLQMKEKGVNNIKLNWI